MQNKKEIWCNGQLIEVSEEVFKVYTQGKRKHRYLDDCKKGRIDRVLTKSLSRFARNTVDSLIYARMLREMGISILFEKENIDTAFFLDIVNLR